MSADLLPFARLVEHAKPAGRYGTELFLECGHKVYFAVGYRPDMVSAPCSKCVAAFHEEQERRRIDRALYTILQECRVWIMQTCTRPAGTDTMRRLDQSLETLRRRVENPQEPLRK